MPLKHEIIHRPFVGRVGDADWKEHVQRLEEFKGNSSSQKLLRKAGKPAVIGALGLGLAGGIRSILNQNKELDMKVTRTKAGLGMVAGGAATSAYALFRSTPIGRPAYRAHLLSNFRLALLASAAMGTGNLMLKYKPMKKHAGTVDNMITEQNDRNAERRLTYLRAMPFADALKTRVDMGAKVALADVYSANLNERVKGLKKEHRFNAERPITRKGTFQEGLIGGASLGGALGLATAYIAGKGRRRWGVVPALAATAAGGAYGLTGLHSQVLKSQNKSKEILALPNSAQRNILKIEAINELKDLMTKIDPSLVADFIKGKTIHYND